MIFVHSFVSVQHNTMLCSDIPPKKVVSCRTPMKFVCAFDVPVHEANHNRSGCISILRRPVGFILGLCLSLLLCVRACVRVQIYSFFLSFLREELSLAKNSHFEPCGVRPGSLIVVVINFVSCSTVQFYPKYYAGA